VEATELLKRVRKIEIKTRGLSKNIFAGEYHSAFKGRGMAFSEVREYQYGDDIRNIDWIEEERELTVILLIDVSGSRNFGTQTQLKKNIITEISAVLSFSAIQNNDKIGVIMFSDQVEKFIPPKKGRQHTLRIIRELIHFQPRRQGTDLSEGLRYFSNAIKKRCIAFLISDFMDDNYEEALRIANKRHDLVALNIYDERETALPKAGMIRLQDAESGRIIWVDTGSRRIRDRYAEEWRMGQEKFRDLMLRTGIDSVNIRTDEDYVRPLMNLFKRR
jgi:uncharacterized protein (DUF58 family)